MVDSQGTVEQVQVGRHEISRAQAYDVTRDEHSRRDGAPASVTQDPREHVELVAKRSDRGRGALLLEGAEERVDHEERERDQQIRKLVQDEGKPDDRFEHPRRGPPELLREAEDRMTWLLRNLVRPLPLEPGLRIRGRQTLALHQGHSRHVLPTDSRRQSGMSPYDVNEWPRMRREWRAPDEWLPMKAQRRLGGNLRARPARRGRSLWRGATAVDPELLFTPADASQVLGLAPHVVIRLANE